MAGVFVVTAACNPGKLFGPCTAPDDEPPPDPAPVRELRDVYIVDGFTGLQLGTKENPYSVRAAQEFDALLSFLSPDDYLAPQLFGRFQTAGCYRWGMNASRNVGGHWAINGDAEVALAPAVVDDQPLYVFASRVGAPQIGAGITFVGNHSALADRWRASGKSLRTGGPLLYGDARIDGATFRNFGSLGAETFVAEIVGSGSITNTVFKDYDPSSSDTQVTVNRIIGSENGESITPNLCIQEGNETYASGDNRVQGHTIYWAERGRIRNNKSRGARIGVYGDWGITKRLEFDGNDFEDCEHGFQFRLAAGDFSHEGYRFGVNRVVSSGKNVSLDTCGAPTATRFIRGFEIDPSLSVENVDSRAEYTRAACRMAA